MICNLNIEEALIYLNKNYTLVFYLNKHVNYVFLKNETTVKIVLDSSSYELSINELKNLYSNTLFSIFEDDEEFVDFEKDKEYYSWKQ